MSTTLDRDHLNLESSPPLRLDIRERTAILPIVYLVAVALAELITGLVDPVGGLVTHTFILAALIIHSSLSSPRQESKLYLSLALVPLLRIISLSLPLAEFSEIYWWLIIAVPVLAGAFLVIGTLNYNRTDISLVAGGIIAQPLIGATGVVFGLLEYLALRPEPELIDTLTWGNVLLPAIVLLIATGFTEELVFRGIIQHSSVTVFGQRGLLYVALVFALIQISSLSVPGIAIAFVAGAFYCWAVKETRSLLGVVLSHGIANIFFYLIAPLIF